MNTLHRSLVFAGLSGLLMLGTAHAHDDHSQHLDHAGLSGHVDDREVSFVDLPLTDQHGETIQLEHDLVRDNIVVMSFIYTSCTTVCPLVSSIMSKVQQQLGERVGNDVQLISISVDPQTDSPERLLEYSQFFQGGPGWSWLTGSPEAVTDTLKALGSWSADYANHPPLILIGSGDSRHWSRYYGFTDPEVLLARVDELSRTRDKVLTQADHLAGAHR